MAARSIKSKVENEECNVENNTENNVEDIIIETEPDATVTLEEINKSVNEISGESYKRNKTPKVSRRTIDPTEKIPCKSLFFGKLTYTSPQNGARYIWNDYGSIALIPSGELDTMSNFKPNYLQKPLILVNDPDKVEELNLGPKYEQVANISKLDELFNSGDLDHIRSKIREAIDVNQRDTVISKVRKMRNENKLTDINIINLLKEELKFDIG